MSARLHRVVSGPPDGPAVVFLNSLGSTLAIWEPQAAALEDRYRVVRYDLPGHGRSDARPGRYSMPDLARDLVGLLDELGIARAGVVGISIGGMVAMQLALDAPHRVARLVLSNTSARLGPPGAWADRAELVDREGMPAVTDAVAARWLTPAYAAAHADRLAWIRAMIGGTDPLGYAGCCWAIERMDLRAEIARIEAPTLVISADHDPSIPRADVEHLARTIPHARHEEIRDAAHLPILEQPKRCTELIMAHLQPLLTGADA